MSTIFEWKRFWQTADSATTTYALIVFLNIQKDIATVKKDAR